MTALEKLVMRLRKMPHVPSAVAAADVLEVAIAFLESEADDRGPAAKTLDPTGPARRCLARMEEAAE